MSKQTVLTKSFFTIAGILLLAFSIKLFFNTTSNLQPQNTEKEAKNSVLSFTSSSYDYLEGANNINPNITISTESPILINGINIGLSVLIVMLGLMLLAPSR